MKYNRAYEMFSDMMNFALANGMTSYQSDLMHDAVELANTEHIGNPVEFMWIVKSNGCGTWLQNVCGYTPEIIHGDTGAKVIIKYDGNCWTFEEQ